MSKDLFAELEAREKQIKGSDMGKPSYNPYKQERSTSGQFKKKETSENWDVEEDPMPVKKSYPKVAIRDEFDEIAAIENRFEDTPTLSYTDLRMKLRSNYKPRPGRGLSFKRPTITYF